MVTFDKYSEESKKHYVFDFDNREVKLSTIMYKMVKKMYSKKHISMEEILKDIWKIDIPSDIPLSKVPEVRSFRSNLVRLRQRLGGQQIDTIKMKGYKMSDEFMSSVKLKDIVVHEIESPNRGRGNKLEVIKEGNKSRRITDDELFKDVKKIIDKKTLLSVFKDCWTQQELEKKLKGLCRVQKLGHWDIDWNLQNIKRYIKIILNEDFNKKIFVKYHYLRNKDQLDPIFEKVNTYNDLRKQWDLKRIERFHLRVGRTSGKTLTERVGSNHDLKKYVEYNDLKWRPISFSSFSGRSRGEWDEFKKQSKIKIKEHYQENKEQIDQIILSSKSDREMGRKLDELRIVVPRSVGSGRSKSWSSNSTLLTTYLEINNLESPSISPNKGVPLSERKRKKK